MDAGQVTPEQQFARLLAAEPSRPFVTYYDEASGERAELSMKSLANWVAKTHYLLVDDLGLGVGDRALIAVPAHWISVPVLIGCLSAGLELVTTGDAEVAFVAPDTLAAADSVDDRYAIAPDSAAVGFRGDPPAPAADYVAEVRPQPDSWPGVAMPAGPGDPCLPGLTRAEVAEAAGADLEPAARILTSKPWTGDADAEWLATVFAAIAVGGSLVIVANCTDETVLERRSEQERATVVLS